MAAWEAFNSPGFHELDISGFVRCWHSTDGNAAAEMKDRDAQRAREVLERKAAQHKPRFLQRA